MRNYYADNYDYAIIIVSGRFAPVGKGDDASLTPWPWQRSRRKEEAGKTISSFN